MVKKKKFKAYKILWFYSLDRDLGWSSLSILNANIVDTIYRDLNRGELWAPPDDGTLKAIKRISTLRRRFGWQLEYPA
jgi:hypothetical protein